MADWDVVGNAPAQIQNPWAVRQVAPAPAPATTAGDVVKGVGDAALSGISKVSTGMVGAPLALVNRLIAGLSGGDGQMAADATHEYVNRNFGYDTQTPVGKRIGAAVHAALAPLGESAQADKQLLEQGGQKLGLPPGETSNQLGYLGDIAGTAGLAAPVLAGAKASTEAATLAAQNAPAAITKYGMQTGAENPIARNIAGSSAKPAVTTHNQSIADPVLGAQAGVPTGTKITPQSLEAARDAPNSVYQRAETSIPTGPLSPNAAQTIQGVGADDMIVHSPDTQATIDAQKVRLLSGPLTGSEVVNGQRALRFNGFRNVGSEDPEMSALGQAQLKMADALHQHMVDTLPPDAPVSADQLSAARVALAQNHTIENVLGPNGNVNLTKLAKLHNDNPGMLSGPMADIAQFASDHPEVTRLPSDTERFNPSGFVKDVASVDLKKPLSYIQPFFGKVARRALTGPKPNIAPQVTGLGGEFGPIEHGPPQPPPGMTASPPGAPPAAPAGPPGQLSLADLLSHGVEQSPAEGLSLGSGPQPQGMPFARNAEHEAGGLELEPPRTYGGQPANNQDLGAVMSQGVPEDIMQRAPQSGPRPKVAHSPAFISENASLDNPASLEGIAAKNEAVAKGVQPVSFGADDQEHIMSPHDIERRDLNPAPDSIFIDKKTGQIINSGRMAPRTAQSLLARWKALHGGLGDAF